MCLLSVIVAFCTVQAYFIWDGSQDGRVPASFEEGPYHFIYPTDSDPLPEQTWEPQGPYQAPPRKETEIKWTVVQEGPGEPWHVVPAWTKESEIPTEEPVVPEKPVEDPTEGTPSPEPQPEEVLEVPDEVP
ncbi:MAG: hypothetical protein GQ558_07860, partial [Thermoplasmata archaeon]|nr:hypothetical protein [Thermoplasmata archaeon]